MSLLRVREACEHGRYQEHSVCTGEYGHDDACIHKVCRPGGREIVLLAPIITWMNCDDVLEDLGVPGTDRKFRLVEVGEDTDHNEPESSGRKTE